MATNTAPGTPPPFPNTLGEFGQWLLDHHNIYNDEWFALTSDEQADLARDYQIWVSDGRIPPDGDEPEDDFPELDGDEREEEEDRPPERPGVDQEDEDEVVSVRPRRPLHLIVGDKYSNVVPQ